MFLIAVQYDQRGEPQTAETVHLAETRIDKQRVDHLRLGIEVTIVTRRGRLDYRLAGREMRS